MDTVLSASEMGWWNEGEGFSEWTIGIGGFGILIGVHVYYEELNHFLRPVGLLVRWIVGVFTVVVTVGLVWSRIRGKD